MTYSVGVRRLRVGDSERAKPNVGRCGLLFVRRDGARSVERRQRYSPRSRHGDPAAWVERPIRGARRESFASPASLFMKRSAIPRLSARNDSWLRSDAEDAVVVGGGVAPSVAVARGQVYAPVGSDQHIAEPAVLPLQQGLLGRHTLPVGREREPIQRRRLE